MTNRTIAKLRWRDFWAFAWWLGLLHRQPDKFSRALKDLKTSCFVRFCACFFIHSLFFAIILIIIGRLILIFGFDFSLNEDIYISNQSLFFQSFMIYNGIIRGFFLWLILFLGILILVFLVFFNIISIRWIIGKFLGNKIVVWLDKKLFNDFVGIFQADLKFEALRVDVFIFALVGYFYITILFGISSGFVNLSLKEILGEDSDLTAQEIFSVLISAVNFSYQKENLFISILAGIFIGTPLSIFSGLDKSTSDDDRFSSFLLLFSLGFIISIQIDLWSALAFFCFLLLFFFRWYYYPWHLYLTKIVRSKFRFRLHPSAWDDLCSLRFVGLHQLLIDYWAVDRDSANNAIEHLINLSPRRRLEALIARVSIIALESRETPLGQLDRVVDILPEGDQGFLKQTPQVRTMINEIAEASRRLEVVDRPFLREPYAEILVSKIDAFIGRVGGFREPLASRFGSAAHTWLNRARSELEDIRRITGREPAPQVFRAGDPVDRTQEAFVPRLGVIGQVERQLTLSTGCPGLLIYARRRMGKSTLIRNLDGFVPGNVRITNISMQNPAAFTSTTHFVRLISQHLAALLDDDNQPTSEDLTGLYQYLNQVNERLEGVEGRRVVIALDEFENIDQKIGEGVFNEDLLATIRESIQSHRRIIWIFAGSHPITLLKNAEWPSYLVSAQTIEIPPFTEVETRLLLTDPLKQSPLYRKDDERPRFEPTFWGENGIEWIHTQTAGWPHLVQLLASTAVDLTNESEADCLDQEALELAASRSVVLGDTVLRQLLHGETQSEPEKTYIAGFRTTDKQPAPNDEATIQSLRHRQIMTEENGDWRLKVPLMQQWLRSRG